MRSPFVSRPSTPSHSPMRYTQPSSPMRHTFSESMMEENIDIAEAMITKWDIKAPAYGTATLLFRDNRYEAKQFLNCVKNLQIAMDYFIHHHAGSDKLVRAQGFMQIAMKRLEKEFYEILSKNRRYLDHESVSSRTSYASTRSSGVSSDYESDEDDFRFASTAASSPAPSEDDRASNLVMADLKAIADCMVATGYGKECVKVYKIVRKSIVDEAMYLLGMDRSMLGSMEIHKMEWEVLEGKIKSWLRAVKVSIKTIFYGERILCDHVFTSSLAVRQACFQEITLDGALALLRFPESVAKSKKLTPEKMFRTLDMYEAIANLWPEIESIFSFDSMSTVQSQAINSLVKLRDAACSMLTGFEAAIERDTSKSAVPGGGVHPLTRYVMNYLTFLADYSDILTDITADWSPPKTATSHIPELPEDSFSSAISARLAWLILLLLCKLDGKTKLYKEVAQSYLFLANNLEYIVTKVRRSNLKYLLGDDWLSQHESKIRQYVGNYERMAWSKAVSALPADPTAEMAPDQIRDSFKRFNLAFEGAYQKQLTWIVSDPRMRDEIKESLARKLVSGYGSLYKRYGIILRREAFKESIVRFTPEDLENYLSELFQGSGASGSVSSQHSYSSDSSYSGRSNKGKATIEPPVQLQFAATVCL